MTTREKTDMAEFAEKAAENLSLRLEGKYSFDVIERVKTNDLRLTGIVAEGVDISPVIYVNGYAEMIEGKTLTFEDCMDEIENIFRDCINSCPDAEILEKSPEEIREGLSFRIIGEARNEKLVSGRIFRRIAPGLCAVFDVRVGKDGMIPADESMLKLLGIDEEELIRTSFENAEKNNPATLRRLEDCIGEQNNVRYISDIEELDVSTGPSAFVISNEDGFMGASALFYSGVMEKLRKLMGCDYYVLPSSIHELIVAPEKDAPPVMELSRFIAEANSIIPPEHVLTDMPYIYRENGGLQQVHLPDDLS